MNWLIILTLKSILSSIIGSSFYQWFKNTKMGVWFQVKMDNTMEWIANRYDLEIASREEKWLKQYPLLGQRIVDLEKEVANLKKKKQENIMDWIKARIKERTSWDGAVLIGGGIAMLLVPTTLIGWGMIAYGGWTIWKKED